MCRDKQLKIKKNKLIRIKLNCVKIKNIFFLIYLYNFIYKLS